MSIRTASLEPLNRRTFLIAIGAFFVPITSRRASAQTSHTEHPEPRPGITGVRVLKPEQLKATPDLIPTFDGIRKYPELADGIRCSCGCATLPNYRSLLSCYENPGMATMCEICQGEGELLVRRAREGQTLAQIRSAIDARFNGGKE